LCIAFCSCLTSLYTDHFTIQIKQRQRQRLLLIISWLSPLTRFASPRHWTGHPERANTPMMPYSYCTLRAPNSHLTQCRHGKSRVLDEITNSGCGVTLHVLLPSIVHVNTSNFAPQTHSKAIQLIRHEHSYRTLLSANVQPLVTSPVAPIRDVKLTS
jgi:hypothetical protein